MAQRDSKIGDVERAPFSDAMMRRFADMASILPRGTEDGGERILEQILAATELESTNEIWSDTWEPEKLTGEPLIITGAMVLPSSKKGGLGVFLLVDAIKVATGEAGKFSTGSVSIVGQIVVAYTLGKLPFTAKIVVADDETASGFLPQHLEILPDAPVLGS